MPDAVTRKQIDYQAFLNRESQKRHHRYDEELQQYSYLKNGDLENAIKATKQMFRSDLTGHLSENPIRNYQYLFVASVTLATRFAIQGGLDEEVAFNTSDLYIQKVDKLDNVPDIFDLQIEMFTSFTKLVRQSKLDQAQSLPILRCIEYIDLHSHETITLTDLAKHTGYSSNYISQLFKERMNQSVKSYIQAQKIAVAKNMLLESDYSLLEISETLSFSSQSYFTKVFKKMTGEKPLEYRANHLANAIHTKESKNDRT